MNDEFRADLHIHSHFSDGSDTPLAILDLAKDAHLSGLSITDHDTILAYAPEFFAQAIERKIEILIGVEISSELEGQTVHILAYAFDRSLQQFLDRVVACRLERNRKILEKLSKRGIIIDEKELHSSGPQQIVGRTHIAQVMVKKKAVGSIEEAFDRFLNDNASCYASGGKFTPAEVVDAIHACRGKTVLAHPHFIKQKRFLDQLLKLPFDGIECYYGRLPKQMEKPWLKIAEERHLIPTGGSDYHGKHRPFLEIGSSWIGREIFQKLIS